MSKGHRFFHIDVFTRVPGQGNPAAVVVGAGAIPDTEKQMIARELGLPGTGFLWSDPDWSDAEEPNTFRVRFFTPTREVGLSGHTTLASAHAFFSTLGEDLPLDALRFRTRSETLTVEREGAWRWLTLPPPALAPYGGALREVCQALGLGEDDLRSGVPLELSREHDLLIPLSPETDIGRVTPDPRALAAIGVREGIRGFCLFTTKTLDPTSALHARFFAPHWGIPEDPATGSVQGPLALSLWKHELIQPRGPVLSLSSEQGDAIGRPSRLKVELSFAGAELARVRVGGEAVTVIEGTLTL